MSASSKAMAAYLARVSEIRATMRNDARAFADAMCDASAEYERAMVADIGAGRARRQGALAPSLRSKP